MQINEYIEMLDLRASHDSKVLLSTLRQKEKRGAFIDCGSNLGQGFKQFSRHFSTDYFDYFLVEPNPNCWPELELLIASSPNQIFLVKKAASTTDGIVKFYGLEHDLVSQGGSTLAAHNSKYYKANIDFSIDVPSFDFSSFIAEKYELYGCVVLKMDNEGAEYDVLPYLIDRGTHKLQSVAYVEFHSQYMSDNHFKSYRTIESEIRNRLLKDQIPFRDWF